jgi:hypothetical protein
MRQRRSVTGDLGVDDSFLRPAHEFAVSALADRTPAYARASWARSAAVGG